MRETRILMGMPITVEVVHSDGLSGIEKVFRYFEYVDKTFSTYKEQSEISRLNRGELKEEDLSDDMREVLRLSDETKAVARGFFDIRRPEGSLDPSGLVKGWAISNVAKFLDGEGFADFFVDAGGDIETRGMNALGKRWSIGIRDPFVAPEIRIVKTVFAPREGTGVATSGAYIRGDHIYDPHDQSGGREALREIASMTVVGRNAYEADRFATAAFAMGRRGIEFIESLEGFEGYMIDEKGVATMTSGFGEYTGD